MPDIFLSYAREDRGIAQVIAEAFEARGWGVWWDAKATPGVPFDREIENELAAARCVVVLWSKSSVESAWVKNEAAVAAERGILVPVLLHGVRPPLAFRHLHSTSVGDLSNIDATVEWSSLIQRVMALAPPAPVEDADRVRIDGRSGPTTDTAVTPVAAVFEPLNGKAVTEALMIPHGPWVVEVGRAIGAGVFSIDDETVSRKHAEIQVRSDGVILMDLLSSAGTFVNGARVASSRLRDGDLIRFGASSTFRFRAVDLSAQPLRTSAIVGATARSGALPGARTLIEPDIGLHLLAESCDLSNELPAAMAAQIVSTCIRELSDVEDRTWPCPFEPALSMNANRLYAGFHVANDRFERIADETGLPFAADLIAARIQPPELHVAWLGRPRAYLYRRDASPTLLLDLRTGSALKRTDPTEDDPTMPDGTLGTGVSALRVKSYPVGEDDVILLSSAGIADVALAAKGRHGLRSGDSLSATAAAISETADALRAAPFRFILIHCRPAGYGE